MMSMSRAAAILSRVRSGRAAPTLIYGAGLAQGLALVTFPAASSILTDPDD
jgi:hypothetical protein